MKLSDERRSRTVHSRIIICDGSKVIDCGNAYAEGAQMTVEAVILKRDDDKLFDQVTVKGHSILKSGKVAKTTRERFYFLRDPARVPAWLNELLKED